MNQVSNPGSITRAALPSDAAAIAHIYNQYVARGNATMDMIPWTVEAVEARIEALEARECLLVACQADQVVGWGVVKKYSPRQGYRVCCETSVFVDATHTGQGLGSLLVTALFERCRQFGYRHAVAKIHASNENSIQFHRRHGFEMVGVQREIGFIRDHWLDVAIMQRIFPEVAPPEDEISQWPLR